MPVNEEERTKGEEEYNQIVNELNVEPNILFCGSNNKKVNDENKNKKSNNSLAALNLSYENGKYQLNEEVNVPINN